MYSYGALNATILCKRLSQYLGSQHGGAAFITEHNVCAYVYSFSTQYLWVESFVTGILTMKIMKFDTPRISTTQYSTILDKGRVLAEDQEYYNVGRRYMGMARMPASRNTFSKPPNSQTKEL